jgi:ABC-type polysaccharide/polyol phosphate export permease
MSASAAETFDSARQRSPLIEELRQLIRYRSLVKQLVLRGVRARYKRSVLGIFWTMLNPLLMMIVLTIVYQRIFQSHIPHYATYTLAGLICWHFFSQTTGNAVSELVWGGTILTRIYVPRAVFAASCS